MGTPDAASDTGTADADNNQQPDLPPDPPDMADDGGGGGDDVAPDMPPMDCGAAPCEPGEECINNVCVLTSSCGSAFDLGVLPFDVPQTVVGSLVTEGVSDLEAGCVGDTSLRDRVITFEVEVDATINYVVDWQGQFDGVVELRTDCEDVNSAVDCSDIENRTVNVGPGRYYLVLDQKLGNAGAFEAVITARELLCTPPNRMCVGDSLQTCPNPQAPLTLDCAGGCVAGVCGGDMCTAPILVTAATGGTFTGDGRAYTNNLDFAANVNCTDTGDPGAAIATPGFEVVFYLPALTAGKVVAVDALTNDTNINAIFIIQMCGDTGTCAAAFKLSEEPDWVVTTSGNYYVIVDKRQPTNNSFNYTVNVF